MSANSLKKVGKIIVRKYAYDIGKHWLQGKTMPKQAKTLTLVEQQKVLTYINTKKHSTRNRALVMTSFLSGMRVGEIASLRYKDVMDEEGKVRSEIRLTAEQTKGNEARIVFVNDKLRIELQKYAKLYKVVDTNVKFFYSQKGNNGSDAGNSGFSANTLTQLFGYIYRGAGLYGASSHSGRRTFITNLASKGVSVRVLMSLAGHKNIGTTQAYIDVNDDMKRSAVNLIS